MCIQLKSPFRPARAEQTGVRGNKKWQVTYIAPLQPPTLAAFPPWGSSAGAGRARPAAAKIGELKKV